MRTEQIRFQQTLAALQGIRITEEVPINGDLTSVLFHFPPGCTALVDVAFGYSDRQIIPREGFIALDNATPVFPIMERVSRGHLIWCVMQNGDAVNPHTISVVVTIIGE